MIACSDAQKVIFGTHMLVKEAEYLRVNARQRLEAVGTEVT